MAIKKENGWWRRETWRLVQTNLREIDMEDLDAERYVEELKAFHATVAMINVGGIVASYQTALHDIQPTSPFLRGDDLGKVVEACHREDIRVIARCDFSKIRQEVFERHPEWAFRQANGEPIFYNGDVHACVMGEYQRERSYDILDEIFQTYDFDGIFMNMSGFVSQDYSYRKYGICHCAACRKAYREFCGQEIPAAPDETYQKFVRIEERKSRVKGFRFFAEKYPHVCVNRDNVFGGFWRIESNTGYGRPPIWPYNASENVKRLSTSNPNLRVSNATVDFIDFAYRHSAVSPCQQSNRIAQSLCNGGEADYYLMSRLDNHQDRSGYDEVKKMFAMHAAHEELFRPYRRRAADLLLVCPREDSGEYRGWFRTLTEGHFLFASCDQDALPVALEKKYRAVILPDVPSFEEEEAQALRQFMRDGGHLIASGRSCFEGLGIEGTACVRNDVRGAYLLYEQAEAKRLSSELTYSGDLYCYRQYSKDTQLYGMLLPPQPFGAPELCYPRFDPVRDQPAWACCAGNVSIPWRPGKNYHEDGYQTSCQFMQDVVIHGAGIRPVDTELPAMAEVDVFTLDDGRRGVYIANNTGCFQNTYYAPLRLPQARLYLPDLGEGRKVRAELAGVELPVCQAEDGRYYVITPEINDMEVITVC